MSFFVEAAHLTLVGKPGPLTMSWPMSIFCFILSTVTKQCNILRTHSSGLSSDRRMQYDLDSAPMVDMIYTLVEDLPEAGVTGTNK